VKINTGQVTRGNEFIEEKELEMEWDVKLRNTMFPLSETF